MKCVKKSDSDSLVGTKKWDSFFMITRLFNVFVLYVTLNQKLETQFDEKVVTRSQPLINRPTDTHPPARSDVHTDIHPLTPTHPFTDPPTQPRTYAPTDRHTHTHQPIHPPTIDLLTNISPRDCPSLASQSSHFDTASFHYLLIAFSLCSLYSQ